MGDSIERCLNSIMFQIDEKFEVVVIDDGSNDGTEQILFNFRKKYSNFKFEKLDFDASRKLGLTRNHSFQIASGDWCIFHIDADDEIGPHIKDFIFAVESLDKYFPHDLLFSGMQIHMARRNFLLNIGPFRNIYRGEDRDLYERLVAKKAWIVINHKRFITRMNRPKPKLILKKISDVTDQAITEIRKNKSLTKFIIGTWKSRKRVGMKVVFFTFFTFIYAYLKARKLGRLNPVEISLDEFVAYRSENTKSLSEWFNYVKGIFPAQIDSEIFY
jgi:glycosyltransferase involved in cell wall biosynthesis